MTQQWSQIAFALLKLVTLPIRAEMERKVVVNRLLCMKDFNYKKSRNQYVILLSYAVYLHKKGQEGFCLHYDVGLTKILVYN
jgi:hypothetical protein